VKTGDRVTLLKLDGIGGTVTNVRGDGRVAVLADCAAQPVVWERSELGPPPAPRHEHNADQED
jgi:hypothetical protein